MSSNERLSRFIVHKELKVLNWYQSGKAHSEAKCEKVSKGEVCPRCATFCTSIYDRRWVKVKDTPIRNTSVSLIIRKRRFYCQTCPSTLCQFMAGLGHGSASDPTNNTKSKDGKCKQL